ncbi:SDR family oxidoreductase [Natrinema sp. LN54]|uniref:SDR family oxidoreductase n=1 Tax=Natrinema sp. LN54 TaxID=3458705 RepID=UPI0040354D75
MSPDPNLKSLEEQTIVITGASSGIGLTTARTAADRGARVVLAARSEDALREATEEIRDDGGEAEYVVADVGDRDDVREIADTAAETYGGFDTWVNGAGISIYGKLTEVPVEDMREQFETNVWGVVYGSLEAAEHLKGKDGGGAIINIGSIVSDRAIILQGSYSASKQAVKGFTDSLRMELERADEPVSVTLVKPSAIDTPFAEHAKNYMETEASLPAPVYAPETVARTILDAAADPQREVTVGGGGKNMVAMGRTLSSAMDTLMETVFVDQQRKAEPPTESDGLEDPTGDLEERGGYEGHVAESSLYTRLRQRRVSPVVVAGLAATALYAGYRMIRGR